MFNGITWSRASPRPDKACRGIGSYWSSPPHADRWSFDQPGGTSRGTTSDRLGRAASPQPYTWQGSGRHRGSERRWHSGEAPAALSGGTGSSSRRYWRVQPGPRTRGQIRGRPLEEEGLDYRAQSSIIFAFTHCLYLFIRLEWHLIGLEKKLDSTTSHQGQLFKQVTGKGSKYWNATIE